MKLFITYSFSLILKFFPNFFFLIYGNNYKKKLIINKLKNKKIKFIGIQNIQIDMIYFEKNFSNEEHFFNNYKIKESPHYKLIEEFFSTNYYNLESFSKSQYYNLFYERNKLKNNLNNKDFLKYIVNKFNRFRLLYLKLKESDYNSESRFVYLLRIRKIDDINYQVISGHHRLAILKYLKYKKIKVVLFV